MRIVCFELQNFRKLRSVRIDLEATTTLLVGANNSGKTTAMDALQLFLSDSGRFRLTDFTLSDLSKVDAVGRFWEAAAAPVVVPGVEVADTLAAVSTGLLQPTDPARLGEGATAASFAPNTSPNLLDESVPLPKSPATGPAQDEHKVEPQLGSAEEAQLLLTSVLPTLDVWIQATSDELYRVDHLLPLLHPYDGTVGVRLQLQPKNLDELRSAYLDRRSAVQQTFAEDDGKGGAMQLWPMSLSDFLSQGLAPYMHVAAYKLDPTALHEPVLQTETTDVHDAALYEIRPQALRDGALPLNGNPLAKLVAVDIVNAQRHLGGEEREGRLSKQVANYYSKHLDFNRRPEPQDVEDIKATQTASKVFDVRLQEAFKIPLEEVAKMGYPGGADPRVVIRTSLQLSDGLKHQSVLRYQLGDEGLPDAAGLELPEGMNGLGYQNLVLMIFNLMMFRDGRHKVGKASAPAGDGQDAEILPLHLVLVEEPEAHLHAQVQQVFIRHAYKTLRGDDVLQARGLGTQLVVSTHSSHIAHEVDFAAVRYFRREAPTASSKVPLSTVRSLQAVFGKGTSTSDFVQRYIKVQHCNVLFADALVLLEGSAERILVPHFVASDFPKLNQSYVEYLDIGGAHAHRLRPLIEVLGIPTLVITDLDAAEGEKPKKVLPSPGTGQTSTNAALGSWLGDKNVDSLLGRQAEERTHSAGEKGDVHFAYQRSVEVFRLGCSLGNAVASTFEDALALENYDLIASATDATGLAAKFKMVLSAGGGDLDATRSALYQALDGGEKAGFAIDVLTLASSGAVVVAPSYIHEGLAWLEAQVSRLPLVPGLVELPLDTSASSTDAKDADINGE